MLSISRNLRHTFLSNQVHRFFFLSVLWRIASPCPLPSSLELVEVPPDVEPVGRDHVGLALDEELRLLPRDVRHRREHVRQVGASALDAVPAKSKKGAPFKGIF